MEASTNFHGSKIASMEAFANCHGSNVTSMEASTNFHGSCASVHACKLRTRNFAVAPVNTIIVLPEVTGPWEMAYLAVDPERGPAMETEKARRKHGASTHRNKNYIPSGIPFRQVKYFLLLL